jgi:hypothetical protein
VSPRVREDSVHPRLQSGACVRPLNFTVRSPRMTQPQEHVRATAVSYAILCAMYVAIAGVLANSLWLGSWPLLIKDLGGFGLAFWVSLAGLALLNGAMSVASFRFFALSQRIRTAVVCVAALFALWRAVILLSYLFMKRPIAPPFVSVPLGWVGNTLLAVGYSMCAYMLWSAARTSNHRSSGRAGQLR